MMASRRSNAARVTVLFVASLVLLGGCGWFSVVPQVDNPTITISGVTETSFTVSFDTASNDPRVGTNFEYSVYVAGVMINSAITASGITPAATVEGGRFDSLSVPIDNLDPGSEYFVTVGVYDPREPGVLVLYDGRTQATPGAGVLSSTLSAAGTYHHHDLDVSGMSTTFNYTLSVTGGPYDVYLVFSNPGADTVLRPEVILPNIYGAYGVSEAGSGTVSGVALPGAQGVPTAQEMPMPDRPVVIKDRIDMEYWGELVPGQQPVSRGLVLPAATSTYIRDLSPTDDFVGEQATFTDAEPYTQESIDIDATCQLIVDDGAGMGLSIWVEDGTYNSSPAESSSRVDDGDIQAMADAFLQAGNNNDIYDWLTNIYGPEWGPHSHTDLIGDDSHITILIYDFDRFNTAGLQQIIGYFWAKDNFVWQNDGSPRALSNERIMFYIDSATAADDYPYVGAGLEEAISTLAHEFQHMISFYRRTVLLGVDTPTWISELSAMVAEDLVADKIGVDGPRGVDYTDGTAGSALNTAGRLADYVSVSDRSVTNWQGSYLNYALSYGFGAFLTRNTFGAMTGAELARAITYADSSTSNGIIASATGTTLEELLWGWGVADLLSTNPLQASPVRFNADGWIEAEYPSSGGINYRLGSINIFNYTNLNQTGPIIYSPGSYDATQLDGGAKMVYRVAASVSSPAVEFEIEVPHSTDVTVVVK